jgi:hypothetical protein
VFHEHHRPVAVLADVLQEAVLREAVGHRMQLRAHAHLEQAER